MDFHIDNRLLGKETILTPADRALEWAVLESDLSGLVSPDEIRRMKLLDEKAWETRRACAASAHLFRLGHCLMCKWYNSRGGFFD